MASLPQDNVNRGHYYWLHLLRPSNPKDVTSKKVVVDSFRFTYFIDNGTVKKVDTNNDTVTTRGRKPVYSVRRLQPFRGGHFIPYSETYANAPNPYGYTEQTFPSTAQNPVPLNWVTPTDRSANKALTALYDKMTSGVHDPWQITGNDLPLAQRLQQQLGELGHLPVPRPRLLQRGRAAPGPRLPAGPLHEAVRGVSQSSRVQRRHHRQDAPRDAPSHRGPARPERAGLPQVLLPAALDQDERDRHVGRPPDGLGDHPAHARASGRGRIPVGSSASPGRQSAASRHHGTAGRDSAHARAIHHQ